MDDLDAAGPGRTSMRSSAVGEFRCANQSTPSATTSNTARYFPGGPIAGSSTWTVTVSPGRTSRGRAPRYQS